MFITLTELRYLIALAKEKHFGQAAAKCFVSQPTLSIALKKLESNLGLQLFERHKNAILTTAAGEEIIAQAQQVITAVAKIEDFATHRHNQFATPLKLGAIHTVGPYLFPNLISTINQVNPNLKLLIEEDMTANLSAKLAHGELDAIIVAKPFNAPHITCIDLYSEPLDVIIPANHPWQAATKIRPEQLNDQPLLLLGSGHCFRDQVLLICPQCITPQGGSIITTSIETIKYMVASTIGISIVPRRALQGINPQLILAKPFTQPTPQREIILAYRSGFSRLQPIETLIQIIQQC